MRTIKRQLAAFNFVRTAPGSVCTPNFSPLWLPYRSKNVVSFAV